MVNIEVGLRQGAGRHHGAAAVSAVSSRGGPDSVRGYRESRLGPKDNFGRPYGGNMKTVARTEVLLPDAGEVAQQRALQPVLRHRQRVLDRNINFVGPPVRSTGVRQPVDYDFSYDKLKQSTGVAVQWLAPLGVFRFSYAIPLNADKRRTATRYGDEIEGFQFSIGQAF